MTDEAPAKQEALAFKNVFESKDGEIVKKKIQECANLWRVEMSRTQTIDLQVMCANQMIAADKILALIEDEVHLANNPVEEAAE